MEPSLIILGVHKGGSTTLFSHLADHGDVRPAYCKELHFFDQQYATVIRRAQGHSKDRNLTSLLRDQYRRYFRSATPGAPRFVSIEATPAYFPDALQAPARIQMMLPDVQLAVTLRDPVARSISHFVAKRNGGFDHFKTCGEFVAAFKSPLDQCSELRPSTIVVQDREQATGGQSNSNEHVQDAKHALARESSNSNYDTNTNDGGDGAGGGSNGSNGRGSSAPHRSGSAEWVASWLRYSRCLLQNEKNPLARSIYAPQLFMWLQIFPPSKLHVIQSEQLFANPGPIIDGLVAKLQLRPHSEKERANFGAHIGSKYSAQYAQLKKHAPNLATSRFACNESALAEFFKPYDDDFYEILRYYYPDLVPTWRTWTLRAGLEVR